MFSFLNNIPPVTKNLLLINVFLYVMMMVFLSSGTVDLTNLLSAHYIGTPLFEPFQIVTHMFMHSKDSIFHIFFNMFLLVMFGASLEKLWGAKHFFIFYFACGLGAFVLDNIVHGMQILEWRSMLQANQVSMDAIDLYIERSQGSPLVALYQGLIPMVPDQASMDIAVAYTRASMTSGVGASGAVFGLLAAFAILFPNTELYLMFIPVPVKAKYLIGLYVLYETYQAFNPSGDNINHWAHIGGALVGAIIVLVRRKTNKTNFY